MSYVPKIDRFWGVFQACTNVALPTNCHFLDNYDVDLRYYHCGHLCTLPNVPMVEEAFMNNFGNKYMMRWGTCLTDETKERDGREVQRLYSDLVKILNQNWK